MFVNTNTCHVYSWLMVPQCYDWARRNAAGVSVAQWIARRTSNPEVVGSSPTGDDSFLILFSSYNFIIDNN